VSDRQSELAMQEVDEDLFREKLNGIWLAFRWYIIGGAIGIVALVAGNELYNSYVLSSRGEASDVFVTARETSEKEPTAAIDSWQAAAAKLSGAYADLAAIQAAAAAYDVGDVEAAIAQYEAIGKKGAIDPALRDVARLNAAMIAADELGDDERARSLLVLVSQKASPWHFSARELLAVLDLRAGDQRSALEAFQQLAVDPETPASIAGRAQQFVSALETALPPVAPDVEEVAPAQPAAQTIEDTKSEPGALEEETPTNEGEGQ